MAISDRDNVLRVNEIFYSIQGESTQAGRPCIFIRLTYCNLRCTYCDTEYAFYEGDYLSFDEIISRIAAYNCKLVEVTGGEPLVQKNVHALLTRLCDEDYEVMLETGGHMDISAVDARVRKIVDVKCPSSGESEKNFLANMDLLGPWDEVKFVIGNRGDFDFALEIIEQYQLSGRNNILFSPVFGSIDLQQLAGWILASGLNARMQVQMHKLIWPDSERGV